MIVLDENLLGDQKSLLRQWGIRAYQIGVDIGRIGMQDEEIVPLLNQLQRPTLFSLDSDFYDRRLLHRQYCVVCLSVRESSAATVIRRFLRHPAFNSQAKRMGAVVRVSLGGIRLWRLGAEAEEERGWSD